MKINKIFTKKRGMLLAGIALLSTSLTSCLKDNGPGSVDFSKSPALVAFQYQAGSPTTYTEAILNQETVVTDVEVTLSVASITLKTPVTVQLVEDPAREAEYAAADTDDTGTPNVHNVLPSSEYSIANGGKVTINPGQQIVKVPITLKGDIIDFTQNYYVAFKLTNASGAQLTSNLNSALMVVVLKSIYQGTYTVTGSFVDKASSAIYDTDIYPLTVALKTVTANSVAWYDVNYGYEHLINSTTGLSYYGNFSPIFIFDVSNNKIVGVSNHFGQGTNASTRSGKLDPSGVNASTGTPGTIGYSFQVSYIMVQTNSIGDRTFFNETFTYTGP